MPSIDYEVTDGVALITLMRPERLNAMDPEMRQGIPAYFAKATEDSAVRAVLIRGEGRAFCAGIDMKQPNVHPGDDILAAITPPWFGGVEAAAFCPKPVVAAVQGWCVGAGFEIALAADICIAAADARFMLPQVSLGIVPGAGGLSRLTRRVGPTWAARLVMLNERISADQALSIGLISEVTTVEALHDRAAELAATLAAQPHAAVRLAKQSLADAADLPLAAAERADRYRVFMLSNTEEKKAAHAAFHDHDRAPAGQGDTPEDEKETS